MTKVAAALALVFLAGPLPGGIELSGDAAIAGSSRTSLVDLDTVVATGRASIAAGSWTASLAAGTKATLRTEWSPAGFIRVLDLTQGVLAMDGAWNVRAGGMLMRSRSAAVSIEVRNGFLIIDVATGDKVVIVGYDATLTLAAGQKLKIKFDVTLAKFTIDVESDAGMPVDVKIGSTTIQVTQGDIVEAVVLGGGDLFVLVLAGDVKVLGPDGALKDVANGAAIQVAGGGEGAVRGRGAPRRPPPVRIRVIPPEPRPTPYRDRTDVSPS